MIRNRTVEAVVLAHRRTSGQHRRAVLLSPEVGMIEADAYGAKRGSLTGKINQFISGTCVLYYNPVRKTWKIEDFSPDRYRPYITASLPVMYTASFFSECIMKTFVGGGEYNDLFHITLSAMDGLSEPSQRDLVIIQFLWRYLTVSGFLSQPGVCSACSRTVPKEESMFLDRHNTALVCSGCLEHGPGSGLLYPGARAYLDYTLGLGFSDALKVGLGSEASVKLKILLISMMDLLTEGSLKTIGSSMI